VSKFITNLFTLHKFEITPDKTLILTLALFLVGIFIYDKLMYFFVYHISLVEKLKKLEKRISELEETE
jgi:hypothetical protein